MICRLCLNTLDEANAVLLFGTNVENNDKTTTPTTTMPENYLVQLISTHLYLCLSRDDAISTCICTDCSAQLESFHNFWKLVELKQTTLCSQFLEIDCDVNWSEDGEFECAMIKVEPGLDDTILPAMYEDCVKDESDVHDVHIKSDAKVTAHKFPCMFCEKSFKMRRYLEEHVATHTGDRPIACPYCEMAFRCRSNMYTHVKTKHRAQWLKARADRESAKFNTNNNVQSTTSDAEKQCEFVAVPDTAQSLHLFQQPPPPPPPLPTPIPIPLSPPSVTPPPSIKSPPMVQHLLSQPALLPWNKSTATTITTTTPSTSSSSSSSIGGGQEKIIQLTPSVQLVPVKDQEPMEAINLTVTKCATPTTNLKRVTRSSRRKTHSPKKVQHAAERNNASNNEESNDEDNNDNSDNVAAADLQTKRIKSELQTCKENELFLANFNALSGTVNELQLRLCSTQQHELHTAAAAAAASSTIAIATGTATGTGTATSITGGGAGAVAIPTTANNTETPSIICNTTSTIGSSSYTCNICGQHLRNQRTLNSHLHNKHNTNHNNLMAVVMTTTNTTTTTTNNQQDHHPSIVATAGNCVNCGESLGGGSQRHRCPSKAKYSCDVCGKSFKMKRYLEEHFATHTGVKLHTCSFCPTEFRSKSNMYHHTKRKHKAEWEQSRATRNAAKTTGGGVQHNQQPSLPLLLPPPPPPPPSSLTSSSSLSLLSSELPVTTESRSN